MQIRTVTEDLPRPLRPMMNPDGEEIVPRMNRLIGSPHTTDPLLVLRPSGAPISGEEVPTQ